MRNVLIWCIDSGRSFSYHRLEVGEDWLHIMEGLPTVDDVTRRFGGLEFHTMIVVPELLEPIKDLDAVRFLRSRCRYPSVTRDSNDLTMYREMFPGKPQSKNQKTGGGNEPSSV